MSHHNDHRSSHYQEEIDHHRAKVFDALSHHSDPVMREIGKQLASGSVEPHELLREPLYVEALQRGMNKINEMDEETLRSRILGAPGPTDPDIGGDPVPAGRR